jgi:hypothetical protein
MLVGLRKELARQRERVGSLWAPAVTKWRRGLKHAFSTAPEPLAPEDERFIAEVAARVKSRRLATPAILALEAVKYTPGLHVALFASEPIAGPLARFTMLGLVRSDDEYRRLVRLLERREHTEALIRAIEAAA